MLDSPAGYAQTGDLGACMLTHPRERCSLHSFSDTIICSRSAGYVWLPYLDWRLESVAIFTRVCTSSLVGAHSVRTLAALRTVIRSRLSHAATSSNGKRARG